MAAVSLSKLRSLPRHLAGAARGDAAPLNEKAWRVLASRAAEEELDGATLVRRTTRPFAAHGLFHPSDAWLFDRPLDYEEVETAGYTTRPSLVDPVRGWVVTSPAHLVRRGLSFNYDKLPKPDVRRFLRARLRREDTIDVPEAVQLRFSYPDESNYAHLLYHLVGGRLRLATQCDVPDDVPLLVGERLHRTRHFADVLRLAGMQERPVIVQDERWVRCERLFLAQCVEYGRENIDYFRTCLSVPDGDPLTKRRIFLARKESSGRHITNMADVEDMCRRFGFDIVSTEDMAVDEEIALFSGARFVIGTIGAGMINIAFRQNAPLGVLELYPPAFTAPRLTFAYIARSLGFDYQCFGASFGNPALGLAGDPSLVQWKGHAHRNLSGFPLDVASVSKILEAMLEPE